MKIAIPVNKADLEGGVCASFGRAPYFLIYDTEAKLNSFLENPATTSPDGAGIKAAQAVVDYGVQVLIAPRCGSNAAQVLQAANVKLYRTEGDSVEENLTAFEQETLAPLKEIQLGHHGRGRF